MINGKFKEKIAAPTIVTKSNTIVFSKRRVLID
jgi:hypothetical protein